jgi:hypothetical protein
VLNERGKLCFLLSRPQARTMKTDLHRRLHTKGKAAVNTDVLIYKLIDSAKQLKGIKIVKL